MKLFEALPTGANWRVNVGAKVKDAIICAVTSLTQEKVSMDANTARSYRIFSLMVVLGALLVAVPFSSPTWAGCAWRGTAPACGSGGSDNCKAGEKWIHAGRSANNSDPNQQGAQFGAPCTLGGRKALCCTEVAKIAPGAIEDIVKGAEQGAGEAVETVKPRHKEIKKLGVKPSAGSGGSTSGESTPAPASHTITADVDLYAQCGGEGKPIGMLKKGQTFADVTCRGDNWCKVGGKGCIWGDYVTR